VTIRDRRIDIQLQRHGLRSHLGCHEAEGRGGLVRV
jgi:hypothetical protein